MYGSVSNFRWNYDLVPITYKTAFCRESGFIIWAI